MGTKPRTSEMLRVVLLLVLLGTPPSVVGMDYLWKALGWAESQVEEENDQLQAQLEALVDVVGSGAPAEYLLSLIQKLHAGDHIIIRPVNKNVRAMYELGEVVGKGMNIKGKSSKLPGLGGRVPARQDAANTGRHNVGAGTW